MIPKDTDRFRLFSDDYFTIKTDFSKIFALFELKITEDLHFDRINLKSYL